MIRHRLARISIGAVCALALMPMPAQAQDEQSGNEITVEAPRSVPVPIERNPYTGAAVAVTTVRMSVLYGDLDLTKDRDAERLMDRVRNVARDACKQLDRMLPLSPDDACTGKAAANAEPVVEAAIAAARRVGTDRRP